MKIQHHKKMGDSESWPRFSSEAWGQGYVFCTSWSAGLVRSSSPGFNSDAFLTMMVVRQYAFNGHALSWNTP